MSKSAFSLCFVWLILAGNLFAQTFPESAVILEKTKITADRQFVLWMPNPKKNPRDPADDVYTCPDETRGSYYSGIVNVSLIRMATNKIINTIEIQGNGISSDDNQLDLPYLIHRGYYSVPKIDKNKEGPPVIMNLKDYNNDGKLHEFALFDAIACMGLQTTLIGYSQKQDRVIQYLTELKTDQEIFKSYWIDYLFGQKPDKKGVWKYEIDYRGRAGALEKYEFRYDRNKEMFFGTRISIKDETNE